MTLDLDAIEVEARVPPQQTTVLALVAEVRRLQDVADELRDEKERIRAREMIAQAEVRRLQEELAGTQVMRYAALQRVAELGAATDVARTGQAHPYRSWPFSPEDAAALENDVRTRFRDSLSSDIRAQYDAWERDQAEVLCAMQRVLAGRDLDDVGVAAMLVHHRVRAVALDGWYWRERLRSFAERAP